MNIKRALFSVLLLASVGMPLTSTLAVTLDYPANMTSTADPNVYFGYTPSSNLTIANCSILYNMSGSMAVYSTQALPTNNTLAEFYWANAPNQSLDWAVSCNDGAKMIQSETRTLNIDKPCGLSCIGGTTGIILQSIPLLFMLAGGLLVVGGLVVGGKLGFGAVITGGITIFLTLVFGYMLLSMF